MKRTKNAEASTSAGMDAPIVVYDTAFPPLPQSSEGSGAFKKLEGSPENDKTVDATMMSSSPESAEEEGGTGASVLVISKQLFSINEDVGDLFMKAAADIAARAPSASGNLKPSYASAAAAANDLSALVLASSAA